MIKNYNLYLRYLLLIFLFLYIFSPLFLLSTFGPGDDLNYIARFSSGFFFNELNSFFLDKPVYFQRPISAFAIAIMHFFFNDNYKLYLLFFLLFFLTGNLLIFKSIKLLLRNNEIANTFLILSLTPFLSSAFLQSPYLFAELILPIFFWSISIYLLSVSLLKKKYFFFSHIFLLLSLFCTVIAFPLFIFNLIFPIIFWRCNFFLKKYLIKIFFPILIVFIIYFSYLFYIKFFFNTAIYGLSNFGVKSLFQSLYFYFTISFEFILMLLEALKFTNWSSFLVIFILVCFYFYFSFIFTIEDKRSKKNFKLYLVSIFFVLFVNSLIFFISNYPAVTFGYYNRMLITAFITLSLFLSFLLNFKKNIFFLILKILIVTLILNSSKVITNQIYEIENIKKNETRILVQTLNNYKNISDKTLVVARLPLYLKKNYNNLQVFWLTWNLEQLLQNNNLFFYKVFPLSNHILKIKNYNPAHNIFYYNDPKGKSLNSYLYVNQSDVIEFSNFEDLINFLNSQKKNERLEKLNLREQIRIKLKNFFTVFF